MARPRDQLFQPEHQLSSDQQDLLLAALNSQAIGNADHSSRPSARALKNITLASDDLEDQTDRMNGTPDALLISPDQTELEKFDLDFTPDIDYLDGEGYDFENADLGGEMIGALPGSDGHAEQHEKRKNSEDDLEEGDAKRQETQEGEKGAKKPGRKPLTSEPTTKRKAQNRAAQRAFRERKEKHVKDLETKVSELTKAGEADKHENGLLKAQVDRLQVELREYRKRLSLNGSSGNRSPSGTLYGTAHRSNSNPSANSNSFQFEFPKFGALPGSQIFGNQSFSNSSPSSSSNQGSTTPPTTDSPVGRRSVGDVSQLQREGSAGRSASPQSMQTGNSNADSPSQFANLNPSFSPYSRQNNVQSITNTSLPQMNGNANDPFDDLFSPSILKTASMDSSSGYFGASGGLDNTANSDSPKETQGGESNAGLSRVFQFNGDSNASDSASPSTSSSHWNANANSSSCGTSPEPSHFSPANKNKSYDYSNSAIIKSGDVQSQSPAQIQPETGNTDYSVPAVDSFDPVLFGDYRESNDAIVGGADFTGGFFDDALNSAPYDLGSPSNLFGILQSPRQSQSVLDTSSNTNSTATKPSQNLMAEMNKACDGGDDDYGLPGRSTTLSKPKEGEGKMISCNNIWSQLQANPDFQDGKFDLDNLCAELRSKARCSVSGVIVDQSHVDAALRKLGQADGNDSQAEASGSSAKSIASATGDEGTKISGGNANLMFEQQSWDNVLKKLSNNRA